MNALHASHDLRRTRDLLLPRLLLGQIDVEAGIVIALAQMPDRIGTESAASNPVVESRNSTKSFVESKPAFTLHKTSERTAEKGNEVAYA